MEFFELYGRHLNFEDIGLAVDLEKSWYYKKVVH